MKRAGYIRTDNNEGALANWDKLFAEKAVCNYFANLNDKALQDAIQYYLTYSPKTQVYDSSKKLSYRRIDLSKHSESYQLGVLVRYTRNNLFHGGKFGNNVPIKFRPQDVLLMKYGPVILNACLLAVPTFEKILLIWLALP